MMNPDILSLLDLTLTSVVIAWLGLRLVKQIDLIHQRINNHETRLTVAEQKQSHGVHSLNK